MKKKSLIFLLSFLLLVMISLNTEGLIKDYRTPVRQFKPSNDAPPENGRG